MDDEKDELMPVQNKSLFPLSAEDIVDNALQNLDENQARKVTEKAADEVVRLAVEKRKAEYRSALAQDEMRTLIDNANLLDKTIGDYKITGTIETASGTTSVEINKSKTSKIILISILSIIAVVLIAIGLFFLK